MAGEILRYDSDGFWLHRCPGCRSIHVIPNYHGSMVRWSFNGRADRPTFDPSVRHNWGPRGDGGPDKVCHYFIRDGMIQFCGDCTHALAGQTVPLPPLDLPA